MTDHHPTGRQHRLAPRGTDRLRPTLLSLAAAALLSSVLSVQAQPAARDIDIPAQPLDKALGALARQTGARILFSTDLTERKQAPALKGSLTPQQALERLLAGSGLVVRVTQNGGFTVAPKPPEASGETTLPAVRVKASREQETATGPVQGYVAKRSATGTKTDTPIIETPQSISVVGADEIESRKAADLMEALGYVAGVARLEGADHTSDGFVIRGFQAFSTTGSIYRDGTKYSVNGYDGQQEPYGLERIEVLKGASSVLYGTAAPGGIVNTVSKRPSATPLHELNLEIGSYGRKQASGDFGGALSDDGTWSYRLTALARDADTFVDHVPDNRRYVAPALRWQPDARTSLTLLAEYQHDRTAYIYGLPAAATILPNPNGPVDRSRFIGEPGYDKYDLQRYSVGYLFEHAFESSMTLRHSARYFRADLDFPSIWIWGLDADSRTTLARAAQDRKDRSRAVVTDTSLLAKWTSGAVEHQTVAGLDIQSERFQTARWDRTAQPLDLYAPVYGGALGAPEPSANSWKTRSRQVGFYLQDQMKIGGRWVVLLGGRHDSVRYSEGAVFSDDVTAENERSRAFTGRAGVVYLADNGLAPYASFSQSFEPQSGSNRSGDRFSPTRGEQWELGVRFQPLGSDMLLSAAVYDLTRTQVLVTDPTDPNFSVAQGKVRSRGLELEARTKVGAHANLVAAYAYTDARTLVSSPLTPELAGKRSGAVPRNQMSLWSDYAFGGFGLPGVKVGLGVRHVGSTQGIWVDGTVPAFTVFDAMVSYADGPWRFALNVSNLADKAYIASCTYDCFYGEPRKVVATATYRW